MHHKLSLPALALAALTLQAVQSTPASTPILVPEENSQLVRVFPWGMEGGHFIILVPKSLGTWEQTLMNFPTDPVRWLPQDDPTTLSGHHEVPGAFRFETNLQAREGGVTVSMTVTNLDAEPMEGVWIFNFLAPHGAPPFLDPEGQRTMLPILEEPMLIASLPWAPNADSVMAVFPVGDRLPAQLRSLNVESAARPSEGWMVAVNESGDQFAAIAAANPLFLFRNKEISSLHVAPSLGDVPVGGSASVEIQLLFGDGGLEEAVTMSQTKYRALQQASGVDPDFQTSPRK